MPASVADVREIIIGDTAASDEAIKFRLNWADRILDQAESRAGSSYTNSDRDILQRLLAAHGVEREPVSQSVGQTSERFSEKPIGEHLRETSYGRDAIAFDPLDVLENFGKKVPSLEGYGTTYDASDPEV